MRIALHAASEVGRRVGRMLLAERDLTALGLLDTDPSGEEPRVRPVADLASWDVLVTDTATPRDAVARAADAGVSAVVWCDGELLSWEAPDHTLLVGANAVGLLEAIATHELGGDAPARATLAWTEPGRPLRRGTAVTFPEPVGPRWAELRPPRRGCRAFAAPLDEEWAGLVVRIREDDAERIIGVSELAPHLEALALAAGAVTAARGKYGPGLHRPADAADAFLAAALDAGLDVATYRS